MHTVLFSEQSTCPVVACQLRGNDYDFETALCIATASAPLREELVFCFLVERIVL